MTDAQFVPPRPAAPSYRVVPPPARPEPPARRGSRARSGNGMTRSRACILSGAAKCIVRYGTRKTTMGDVAREGGIAKGTLYNHFRAKADVYAALVADEADDLLTQVAALPAPPGSAESVAEAFAFAAEWLSEHPVLRALREREPELVARLARPQDTPAWHAVRDAALRRVSLAVAAGALHPQTDPAAAVEALLRWAVSHVGWPAAPGTAAAAARGLVHGLLVSPHADAPGAPGLAAGAGTAGGAAVGGAVLGEAAARAGGGAATGLVVPVAGAPAAVPSAASAPAASAPAAAAPVPSAGVAGEAAVFG